MPDEQSQLAELRGVRKRYGQTVALDGLDLQVRPGELLAVLGPNGAGKSTAIGLWLGTLRSDSGEVRTLGGDPTDVHSRLELGCMLQDVRLAPMLSAREHIDLTRRCYRDPLGVDECIELAGIGDFAERRYGKLSGGQQRQVQFALAICGRPRLLFLDEPTVGLDLPARERLWASLRQLVAQGRSIVLTTHYLEEAEALADRVAVLAGGRLLAEGSVAQMRELVSRTRIRCLSDVEASTVRQWPGVVEVSAQDRQLQLTASDPETVVRRLLQTDPQLSRLEVRPANLAEAFSELTLEAA
ncbi:MAG: ABC transporter ATP-binding protein [Lysobacterales bacterium]